MCKRKILTFVFTYTESAFSFQDPAGIFELVEVVGNGTYGQVYKVGWRRSAWPVLFSVFFYPLIKPGNKGTK